MKINEQIKCVDFPCTDIDKNSYVLPFKEIDTECTRILMITEAPPNELEDYFYADGNPFYLKTTV